MLVEGVLFLFGNLSLPLKPFYYVQVVKSIVLYFSDSGYISISAVYSTHASYFMKNIALFLALILPQKILQL